MNLKKVLQVLQVLQTSLSNWFITLFTVTLTVFLPVTNLSYLLHTAMRAREARAADRGARFMFRSVFFMGFLRPLFTIHEELGEAGASAEYYDEREY